MMGEFDRSPEGRLPSVKHFDCLKGFKGKGAAWAEETRARLMEVHAALKALAKETRSIRGREVQLAIHAGNGGAKSVRWRQAHPPYRHLLWKDVEALLPVMPAALAQWYRQAHAIGLELNLRDVALRYELKQGLKLARLLEEQGVDGREA